MFLSAIRYFYRWPRPASKAGVLHAIEVDGVDVSSVTASVYMAPNALDYSGYPDCRPEFYEAMKNVLALGSKLWTEYGIPIKVETPIIELTKAEIVALGMKLGAPLEYTWSCYEGGGDPLRNMRQLYLTRKRLH